MEYTQTVHTSAGHVEELQWLCGVWLRPSKAKSSDTPVHMTAMASLEALFPDASSDVGFYELPGALMYWQ